MLSRFAFRIALDGRAFLLGSGFGFVLACLFTLIACIAPPLLMPTLVGLGIVGFVLMCWAA